MYIRETWFIEIYRLKHANRLVYIISYNGTKILHNMLETDFIDSILVHLRLVTMGFKCS